MRWCEDVYGRRIRLTGERQEHIADVHPEMSGQAEKVDETLLSPDVVVRSRTDQAVELFYRHYNATPVTSKYMCVLVKSTAEDLFVITAYFTDSIKRGDRLWEKK
jgi:hypothetical protein